MEKRGASRDHGCYLMVLSRAPYDPFGRCRSRAYSFGDPRPRFDVLESSWSVATSDPARRRVVRCPDWDRLERGVDSVDVQSDARLSIGAEDLAAKYYPIDIIRAENRTLHQVRTNEERQNAERECTLPGHRTPQVANRINKGLPEGANE
jgi:hypothetical protein